MGNSRSRTKNSFLSSASVDELSTKVTRTNSSENLSTLESSVHQIMGTDASSNTLSRSTVAVAMHSYETSDWGGSLEFQKGDRLSILNDSGDWWYVKHTATNREGFVPRNFVAREMTIESKEWFFGDIMRGEAENLLMQPHNGSGTFLIRNCEKQSNAFFISVKDSDSEGNCHIHHYMFLVTVGHVFTTLQHLVQFYSEAANGFCCKLTKPCDRSKPPLWDLSPETRDRWEIDPKELTIDRRLGDGNFGEVFYGKWRGTTEVAIKSLKSSAIMSKEEFLREATTMKSIRHKKLVSLYAVCSVNEPMYIVTEYMRNGSLLGYLRNGDGKYLKLNQLINIAAQIASGMKYLERKQLVHRDLAARNVLVGENNVVKIADFGLARIIGDSEYTARIGGKFPVKWTAPEALFLGKFTMKSDIWSFGILMMELITLGHIPYPGMHNYEVMDKVRSGYRMPYPSHCDCHRDIYDLMLKCWEFDPTKRPTFHYLFTYLDDFNVIPNEPKCYKYHRYHPPHRRSLSLVGTRVKGAVNSEPWCLSI